MTHLSDIILGPNADAVVRDWADLLDGADGLDLADDGDFAAFCAFVRGYDPVLGLSIEGLSEDDRRRVQFKLLRLQRDRRAERRREFWSDLLLRFGPAMGMIAGLLVLWLALQAAGLFHDWLFRSP